MDIEKCIIDPEVNADTEICQYLDFDYLMSIILRGKYCVKQKSEFIDKRESDLFSKWMFPLRPARDYDGIDHSEMGSVEEMNVKLKEFKNTGNYYTSCWTLDTTEKIFMWQTYASKLGVRIKTTIGDFIKSLKACDEFSRLECHKIKYKNVTFYDDFETYLTTKDKAFEDEREVRFYFLNEMKKEECINHEETKKIFIPVDYHKMIKSVIISPFVEGSTASWLCENLSKEFNLTSSISEIKIKK